MKRYYVKSVHRKGQRPEHYVMDRMIDIAVFGPETSRTKVEGVALRRNEQTELAATVKAAAAVRKAAEPKGFFVPQFGRRRKT